eukprot:SAG31_NODE_2083_length_6490_cov_21.969645_9_plen_67_part_00
MQWTTNTAVVNFSFTLLRILLNLIGAAAVVARPAPAEYGAAGCDEDDGYDGQEHEGASPEYSPDAR